MIFSGNDIIFTYKEEMRRYNLLSGHKHSYPMGAIGAEQFCYSIADYAKANRPFTENSELFPWLLRRLLDVLDAGEQKKYTTELVHRINKCFLALRFPGIFCDLRGRLLLVDFEGNLHTVEELLLDISERVCGP